MRILSVVMFLAIFYSAEAQVADAEMEAYFSATNKIEHQAPGVDFNIVESYYSWVEKDSLYYCDVFSGYKIALSDIDLDNVKSELAFKKVKNSNDYVYSFSLQAINGKGLIQTLCNGSVMTKTIDENYDFFKPLEFRNEDLADRALAFLREKKKKAGIKTTLTYSNTAAVSGNFDSQLAQLINGLKNNYASLKGQQLKGNEYLCTVALAGAVKTKISVGMMGITRLFAEFGDFNSEQEATVKYTEMVKKIGGAKKMPVTMVQQNEMVSPIGKTTSWLPLDTETQLDPALKGFSLVLEMVKSTKFDKDYNKQDYYYVQLKISK